MSEKIQTMEEGRRLLRENWQKGIPCPLCTQLVKLYRRKLNSQMGRALILIYRHQANDSRITWLDVNAFLLKCGINSGEANVALLRHWNLLERKPERKADGNNAGMYRITELGCRFVRGEIAVPKYIFLFNQKLYQTCDPVEQITIRQALGQRFDYAELMTEAGVRPIVSKQETNLRLF
ncbi:MAG: hypothetical protein HY231_24160 [Acidobacteria bacterium]|nr:hypothetical protein [Acidobacteriota bacterium]